MTPTVSGLACANDVDSAHGASVVSEPTESWARARRRLGSRVPVMSGSLRLWMCAPPRWTLHGSGARSGIPGRFRKTCAIGSVIERGDTDARVGTVRDARASRCAGGESLRNGAPHAPKRVRCDLAREDALQRVGCDCLELVVAAVSGPLVDAPAQERRR